MKKKMKIEFFQEIKKDKYLSLWYGGDVASIKYEDYTIMICANGDVRGYLYKDGKLLTSFKDKQNNGAFEDVLNGNLPDIDNDKKLLESIFAGYFDPAHVKEQSNLTGVYLDNNNWWEAFIYNKDEYIDSFVIEETDNIKEAIFYIGESIDNIITWIKEEE